MEEVNDPRVVPEWIAKLAGPIPEWFNPDPDCHDPECPHTVMSPEVVWATCQAGFGPSIDTIIEWMMVAKEAWGEHDYERMIFFLGSAALFLEDARHMVRETHGTRIVRSVDELMKVGEELREERQNTANYKRFAKFREWCELVNHYYEMKVDADKLIEDIEGTGG